MIYACDDCGFLFRRFRRIEQCPMCKSGRIRAADNEKSGRATGPLTLFLSKKRRRDGDGVNPVKK